MDKRDAIFIVAQTAIALIALAMVLVALQERHNSDKTMLFQGLVVIQRNSIKAFPPTYIPRSYTLATKYDTESQVIEYILEKFGDKGEVAAEIANCESRYNAEAVNWGDAKITGYPSYGIFQINGFDDWDWKDYKENTDRAYEKYLNGGWAHWKYCSNKVNTTIVTPLYKL